MTAFLEKYSEALIYSGTALVVLIVGYIKFRYEILFMFRKQETEGVITNWMATSQEGKRYFYPMIDFQLEDGQRITFRAEERSEGKPMYAPGTKVKIQYLAQKPTIRKVIYP